VKRSAGSLLGRSPANLPDPGVWRGYLIKTTLGGETFVEKGGTLICWAKDAADARAKINELLD
jgi:hypothetical protein